MATAVTAFEDLRVDPSVVVGSSWPTCAQYGCGRRARRAARRLARPGRRAVRRVAGRHVDLADTSLGLRVAYVDDGVGEIEIAKV